MTFFSQPSKSLGFSLDPFFDYSHDVFLHWNDDIEKFVRQMKITLPTDTDLVIPNTSQPICITIDASCNGDGCILFQAETNKLDWSHKSK